MKLRNLLITLGLTLTVGAGVTVATSAKQNEEPKAAEAAGTAKFYLIRNWDWGTPRIHYWGGDSKTTWDSEPAMNDEGVNVTRGSVTGRLYSYTIPTNTTGIVIRDNGRTQQTADYFSWNSAGNNAAYFSWTDNQNKLIACSYKNTNPSSSTNQFYVYDPHLVLGENNLANINVYGYGETDVYKAMSWPGTHSGVTSTTLGITPVYSISLSVTYPNAVINCGNGNNQTGNLTGISGQTGKVLVIKEGHSGNTYNTEWVAASIFNGSGNYPTSGEGYYIVNSDNSYSFTGSIKMSASTTPYVAQITNYSATKGKGIKVRGFYNDREDPNIWSYYDGDTEIFGHADGDANFVFDQNIVVDIYAKFVNSELKFYVLEHINEPGYYILGDQAFATDHSSSALEWTFASGLKMETLNNDPQNNRASFVLTVSTDVEIRVRECISLDHGWLNFGETYDTDYIKTKGTNVQIVEGTYTLYVSNNGSAYILKGIPLDAFCTNFLSTIGGICEEDGSTPTSSLFSAWSTMRNLYADVLESEKTIIYEIGFNGGSDVDDAHKVVKMYHYIVCKYGTAKCNDFIWNQNITGTNGSSKILLNVFGQDNTNTILVIAVVASLGLLSLGGYYFFRKSRKTEE